MLRLIIVDDEEIILEALSELIDYASIGFELIGRARNGMEALNLIEDFDPDVVITDIRMPLLDGLQLIERANRLSAHPEFILLSGYDEFEYARKAMRFGVKHYLLKPTDREELIGALESIRQEYDHTAKMKHLLNDIISVSPQEASAPFPENMISQCKAYVENHLSSETLSLKWLAENYCFVSVGYLSKQFVKTEGLRFSDYLNRLRVKKAKELILYHHEDNIKSIASQVGFASNPQYFGQVFKKYEGITPSDYIHSIEEVRTRRGRTT